MSKVDSVEQYLLLEGIFVKYGYDFRQYAEASFQRRIQSLLNKYHVASPLNLLQKILDDKSFFYEILPHLTVSTTELFRDPDFFSTLRKSVVPLLKTYPRINLWIAGCSTGEELYSLSILLKEEGLADRSTIFATDINPHALKIAKEGIYSLDVVKTFTKNYIGGGGTRSPSDYYVADYGSARFDPTLRENVVFSEHNLVMDSVFTEAHLILCRNVMIYFSRELQDRVLELFSKSLGHRGFLGLGSKEAIRFSTAAPFFDVVSSEQRIFQKKPEASRSAYMGGFSE